MKVIKPYRGTLTDWHKEPCTQGLGYMYVGLSSGHPYFHDQRMHTSWVERDEEATDGSRLVETRSSVYLLLPLSDMCYATSGKQLLTMMVGPSGAGKSVCANMLSHTTNTPVISSDAAREQITGTIEDQSKNEQVFSYVHGVIETRVNHDLPIIMDATNLRRKDRVFAASLAPIDTIVKYVVVDRPLDQKIRDGGWRNDVMIKDKTLVQAHHERFQSVKKDVLKGDGLSNVVVDNRIET